MLKKILKNIVNLRGIISPIFAIMLIILFEFIPELYKTMPMMFGAAAVFIILSATFKKQRFLFNTGIIFCAGRLSHLFFGSGF